jgi:probable F420-dependent oxidoreductase
MNRWGITLPLGGVALPATRALVEQLESLGYTDVWTSEVAGLDAFSPLAMVAAWAPSLRLGTAIVPVYTRGPGLLAMSAAALAEIAPGRFVLGLGTSSPVIVEHWNSMHFEAPVAKVRDTVRFLRAALAGEKVTADYPTLAVRNFRLERPPEQIPPVMLAALRPTMLRLASQEADGVVTTWLSADDVCKVRAEVGVETELVARLFVIPTEDATTARAMARRMLTSYLTVPAYAAFHEWLGRGDELRAMHAAWQSGDRKGAGAAISDAVVDDLVVHGAPARCRQRIEEYVANGLTTPVIEVINPGGDAEEFVRSLAPHA